MDLDDRIAELSQEYRDLSTTLRYFRLQIMEVEERSSLKILRYEPNSHAEGLRSRYVDGKRRIAEIRVELADLHPSTLDGIREKAVATNSRAMDKEPSLTRSIARITR